MLQLSTIHSTTNLPPPYTADVLPSTPKNVFTHADAIPPRTVVAFVSRAAGSARATIVGHSPHILAMPRMSHSSSFTGPDCVSQEQYQLLLLAITLALLRRTGMPWAYWTSPVAKWQIFSGRNYIPSTARDVNLRAHTYRKQRCATHKIHNGTCVMNLG